MKEIFAVYRKRDIMMKLTKKLAKTDPHIKCVGRFCSAFGLVFTTYYLG